MKRDVAAPESIADHMYRMGMMGMLVQGSQYDYARSVCVRRDEAWATWRTGGGSSLPPLRPQLSVHTD